MQKEFRVHSDCFPCFLRQTALSLSQHPHDEDLKLEIMRKVLDDIEATDISKTPAHSTTFLHRRIRNLLGIDPFKEVKQEYNQIALSLYPALKKIVKESPDPLKTASRLSIAGNAIDFGIYSEIDLDSEIARSLNDDMEIDEYDLFLEALDKTDRILYLADNAGEIVFDRILVETLTEMGKDVTAAVKKSPVINDSTRDDAIEAGLNKVCRIIDNGSDAIGTILEWCDDEFREAFLSAPLIISKGQGNFETLIQMGNSNIFFLFQAKCDVVADFIGVKRGAMLLIKGGK